ncbi:emp24/gp25L/p24 family protein KNAG_0C03180 [Huiozyma naganishii CBS 8797]|uniref:GOLD domain-containing protein n=1 Tax=Huiozyma naganishii (strain ATCC MYA-139 / BCRC 22969 / CBS 8797 / KCTC 17520 / NBRC 10181 / NCYC 3082 / Yp74L-3) TaxID=1071383 RepID=J7RIS5_HUIN7|nr:hypothetical protein KNAG_0C03180 [Kazachstania naganishii CBS 8797]CCK69428.1 hypothetical protein KNAG_0C03180 [Kazachstania naganishii CBS 8797]
MKVFNLKQWLVFSVFWHAMSHALHFDVPATSDPSKKLCIRDFVSEGQMVVISITTDGSANDGQQLNFFVYDSAGNEYRSKRNFVGDAKVAFVSPATTSFDMCLENQLQYTGGNRGLSRSVELDVEIGSQARDWNQLSANEKLKPIEVELRKIEELTDEIVDELVYMKMREERLRDTNESTNSRVINFFLLTVVVLGCVAVWQITYLKRYFKTKHII